jgi:hypothetical protein
MSEMEEKFEAMRRDPLKRLALHDQLAAGLLVIFVTNPVHSC